MKLGPETAQKICLLLTLSQRASILNASKIWIPLTLLQFRKFEISFIIRKCDRVLFSFIVCSDEPDPYFCSQNLTQRKRFKGLKTTKRLLNDSSKVSSIALMLIFLQKV